MVNKINIYMSKTLGCMKTLYLHISPYNQYIIIQTIKYQG